ncbi:MAG: hypothetical protein JO218_15620, partial [Burkholderiales bacterium]|nr:hypothetical protein [Burkholderiales bacterium]
MFDFRGLIEVLRRKAREEDYAGPSLTQMMIDMPRDQILVALTEIVKGIAALNRDGKVGLKERYRAVAAFDDRSRPLLATMVNVYRGHDTIPGLSARQALPVILACWQELAAAYKVCLKQHAQSPSPRFAPHAELITLRAVAYYAQQAKWSYLRYFEPDSKIWRNLNRLYHIADAAGFAAKPMALYPDEAPTSVNDLYLRAALLKLAEPERRRPEDVWLIDDWLAARLDTVRMERVIRPREQTFGINLDDAKPPMKLRRNMVGERYRYLATDMLASQFSVEAGAIRRGERPAADTLGSYVGLFDDLAVVYSRAGQQRSRRAERKPIGRDVRAALGVTHSLQAISGSGTELEPWTLVDESANGLGAHYKARFDDRLTVGELVLLREADGNTSLNVVRRLTKSREGQVRVGAERIAAGPVAVTISLGGRTVPALFCNESAYGSRALVFDRMIWTKDDDIVLTAAGKRYGVQLGPILETLPEEYVTGFLVKDKR